MIKLDFTITDAFQRAQIVREICEQNPNLTNDELELLTTYCVCGVAPGESKSPVQRKEIFLDNAKRPEESGKAITMAIMVETYAVLALLISFLGVFIPKIV